MDLSPAQAEKEWKAGKFRSAYLLVGEEASARESAFQKLKEALSPDPFNFDEFSGENGASAAEAVSAALTPPLMRDRRLVVVKHPKLGAEARKLLADYLREPMETTTLVLFSEDRKPDPRDILSAAMIALGGVMVFKTLRAEEAAMRIADAARAAGKPMDASVGEFIVEESGTDWGVLKAELEKIILFTRSRNKITREDALACLGYQQSANPFSLPRVVQARDLPETLRLLARLLEEGEEPLRLLYQISSAINKQLKAKRMKAAGITVEQIFRELRLQPYYDRDFMLFAGRLNELRLIRELKACIQLEASLKSKPWLDAGIEIERLAAEICKPTASTTPAKA